MTFEPVFASAFAIAFGGESLTWRLLVGGSMILGATLLGIRSADASRGEDCL
jgi:drug/metabolite transporter (DMT)-like permease